MLAESRVVPSPADGESGASYSPLGLRLLTAATVLSTRRDLEYPPASGIARVEDLRLGRIA
jgi:hypothetical protein